MILSRCPHTITSNIPALQLHDAAPVVYSFTLVSLREALFSPDRQSGDVAVELLQEVTAAV